jgi:hypothetical protein
MTEAEYLCATNRAKVSAALVIMRDVLPGPEYGIDDEYTNEIIMLLETAENILWGSYSLEPEEKSND